MSLDIIELPKFNIGDVVQMKMGGPRMTVERIRVDTLVCCVWFDGFNQLQRDAFDQVSIQRIEP